MAANAALVTALNAVGIPLVKESLPQVIDAFVTSRRLNKDILHAFIRFFQPTTAEVIAALQSLSKDQSLVSAAALEVVREAVSHCRQHLACCSSTEERAQVSLHVITLAKEARAIADSERRLRLKLLAGTTGVAMIAGATILGLRYPRAGASLFNKGCLLLGKLRIT